MTEPTDETKASRRRFLAGAAGLAAAGASVRAALADNAKNLPPNVPTGRASSATASACGLTAIRRNTKRTSSAAPCRG